MIRIKTNGVRNFWSIYSTAVTPNIEPKSVKGMRYLKSLKFALPDFINLRELVKEPAVALNLLVPRTMWGGNPANIKAGTLMRPPPPAMESTKEATKPAIHRRIVVVII
jgi:hypothetical protein